MAMPFIPMNPTPRSSLSRPAPPSLQNTVTTPPFSFGLLPPPPPPTNATSPQGGEDRSSNPALSVSANPNVNAGPSATAHDVEMAGSAAASSADGTNDNDVEKIDNGQEESNEQMDTSPDGAISAAPSASQPATSSVPASGSAAAAIMINDHPPITVAFQGRQTSIEFILIDTTYASASDLIVHLLPYEDMSGGKLCVPTMYRDPDAFFTFLQKTDYTKNIFDGRLVFTNELVDEDCKYVEQGICDVVQAVRSNASITRICLLDWALVDEGESYKTAMSNLANAFEFGEHYIEYLSKMHRYILSALEQSLQYDIDPLTSRLQAVNLNSKANRIIVNGELLTLGPIDERDLHGEKRSIRLEAIKKLKGFVANLTEEQTRKVLKLFQDHRPQYVKHWIHPHLSYADGTTDAVLEVVLDELEANVVTKLCTGLQRAGVSHQAEPFWGTTLQHMYRIPLETVMSNPSLASQRDDPSQPPLSGAPNPSAQAATGGGASGSDIGSHGHRSIQVIGIEYRSGKEFDAQAETGDFGKMLQDSTLSKTSLIIFNDNVKDAGTDMVGGGNGHFRPFAFNTTPPAVLGVPTGWPDPYGFTSLEDSKDGMTAKEAIDRAIRRIVASLYLRTDINKVFFSKEGDRSKKTFGLLGVSTFTPVTM